MKTTSQSQVSAATVLLVAACWLLAAAGGAHASQGCPFDDGSCQEYCSQQGCNMGYCGHFAWIQCICRKCGDEWSWYDKVRYNPDKTVNQTELDSLKLNATSPLILTNSSAGQQQQQNVSSSTRPQQQPQQVQADAAAAQSRDGQAASGLTTLLIPDLSDGSKLDLNDIPDENSEKFLDYLAKNHERLVQATSSRQQQDSKSKSQQQQQPDEQLTAEESESTSLAADDEAVEIQISSNNNNSNISTPAASQQTTTTPTSSASQVSSAATASVESPSTTTEQPQQQRSPLIRLLHMAADEQLFNAGEQ